MKITYHPAKRAWTLQNRGLDFEDAVLVFAGRTFTSEDVRFDYGERRFQTFGHIGSMAVMVVWTPRGEALQVLSMRRCHARELRRLPPGWAGPARLD